MRANRALVSAGYLLAFILVVASLGDATLSILPAHPEGVAWRFGALGLYGRALVTTMLGLGLAMGIALVRGHRRTLRTLGVVSVVIALLVIVGSALFVLDAAQVTGQVQQSARENLIGASVLALVKAGLCTLFALIGGIGAWKASRRGRGRGRWDDYVRPPLVSTSTP